MQIRLSTEERQAEIVAAALRLARESSPALITTSDIAAAIGVTQGAVFKHFPTKDAIWVASMKWVRERLLAKLEEAARAETSGVLALEAVFRAHVAFVIAHPGAPRIIFHELQQPADSPVKQEVRALLHAYRQILLSQLKVGMKVGERRRLVIPPHLAYGSRGAGGVIGPGETLIFVCDLVGVR